MDARQPAMHRTILAADVEHFGDRRRTHPHQLTVRDGMYGALRAALIGSGVSWDSCYHEDRGDGVLILVPPEVPKSRLVASLPRALAAEIRRHNADNDAASRFRLRLVVHAGEVQPDAHGIVGSSVNTAFRLLDAAELKAALAGSCGALALIASEWFFDEVIRHEPGCEPATYRQIRVVAKETDTVAWISLPDQPFPPGEREMTSPAGRAPDPAATVPRQLPPAVPNFVGRVEELDTLTRLLDRSGEAAVSVVISAISGAAGVGKTALALQWARQVQPRFPDGQLYVNLRGYDSGLPLTAGQALDGFLRSLGVAADKLPTDLETQVGLYRSLVEGRRILVVLDNANSAEQVRHLLPGSPSCVAVATSRSRLSGLVARDGAHRVSLDRLTPTESIALLRQIVGARIDAEPGAAKELAWRCAHLPLALRIAAERVAVHPYTSLSFLTEELGCTCDLDFLATEDDETTAIRTVFSWSYQALVPEAARAFRLLGMHAGPDISMAAAAALLDRTPAKTRPLLETLANVHLLEETAPDRYRFHDLLRAYAIERVEAEESADLRDEAVDRELAWYLHTANMADRYLMPYRRCRIQVDPLPAGTRPLVFEAYEQALRWCQVERANLIAGTRQAARTGRDAVAWKLPAILLSFFYLRKHWSEWIAVHDIGLSAADRFHDQEGRAWMLLGLGIAHRDVREFTAAVDYLRRALETWRSIDHRWSEGGTLHNLGAAYHGLGKSEQACDCLSRSLAIARDIGERWGEGRALSTLGHVYRDMHRTEEALDQYRKAMVIRREIGDRQGVGSSLSDIGNAFRDLGR
jgi:tetratricopeptide (TPR) repeat protein